ncbi:hypothetical protein EAO71_25875 [Streptomyces sp. ms191]|nr:hypothetical protein EAO71_25875 [Streptomyces sp. ms191]
MPPRGRLPSRVMRTPDCRLPTADFRLPTATAPTPHDSCVRRPVFRARSGRHRPVGFLPA